MTTTDNVTVTRTRAMRLSRFGQRPARFILRLLGWRVDGAAPGLPRYVLIGAHHTANMDGLLTLLITAALGIQPNILFKESWLRGPAGPLIKALGGVGIDRGARHNAVSQIVGAYEQAEENDTPLVVVMSPEGTRKRVEYWKTGFYYIALNAGVPIALGYLDYARKTGGIGPLLRPTGDIEADMALMRAFYATVTPRHPEQAGVVRVRPAE